MLNDSGTEKSFSLDFNQFMGDSDLKELRDALQSDSCYQQNVNDMLGMSFDGSSEERAQENETQPQMFSETWQGYLLKGRDIKGKKVSKKKKIWKKSLKCDICKIKKGSLKELNRHFHEHMRKSDNKFECLSCGEAIATYEKFIEHIKFHKKRKIKCFSCEICNKTFQFNCLLKDHKNLHLGYRPYLCSNCGKAFAMKASLKQHSRTHGGVKKYKCIYCDFRVFVKADLTKHIRIHTGERPYICEICGESYIQSSHLLVHKRSHSGERPYKCDVCDRGFTKKGDVARHRRIHTGELPYLCQVCGKAFRQSTQCSNHVKHHHPGTVGGKLNIPGYTPNGHNYLFKKSCDT